MDLQKEGELFEAWWENHGQYNRAGGGNYEKTFAWESWIAAKSQAVPNQTLQFNLDEFLLMEQKLKSKGGIIKADLDRFIAYAEIVLEKAKSLKEPK